MSICERVRAVLTPMWRRIGANRHALASLSVAVALAIACRSREHVTVMQTNVVASAVRYRYVSPPDAASQTSSMIKQLEERAATPIASPEDLGELASLYVRRAMLQGDPADYQRAEDMARRSLAMRASPNGSAMVLAKIASAHHEFRKAIEIGQESLKSKPAAGTYELIASCHLALGELEEASAAAELAVAQGSAPAALLTRALVFQAQGRDAEAAFDFLQAVQSESFGDPEEAARTRALWGRFLLRRGDITGANIVISEALRIVPGDPLALAQAAELALRSAHPEKARAMFEQAFAASRQTRYLIDLARAQELSGDLAAATSSRTQAERLIRQDLTENGTGHQLELVEVLLDRATSSDLTEAVTLAKQEVERRPSADTRFQLARAMWRSGARADVAMQIHAVLASGARDARFYELAARIDGGARGRMYLHEAEKLDPLQSGWRTLGLGT